jgi:hypothetical protein
MHLSTRLETNESSSSDSNNFILSFLTKDVRAIRTYEVVGSGMELSTANPEMRLMMRR